jgi:hypothetical protein
LVASQLYNKFQENWIPDGIVGWAKIRAIAIVKKVCKRHFGNVKNPCIRG